MQALAAGDLFSGKPEWSKLLGYPQARLTAEEKAFADQLRRSLTGALPPADAAAGISPPEVGVSSGSTDMGDLSWVVPTVQVHAPTIAIGTPLHTWQVVAQGTDQRPCPCRSDLV